jgi:Copper transport outer membrane protein, MctB
MFDLRYHVASLAAVFIALVIGILVGVGISGPVDKEKTNLLQDRVASLQKQLDESSHQSADREREQQAARTFINETYPTLVHNRLRGKQIAVVFIGSIDGYAARVSQAVSRALADAGAQELRLRALKVPIDVDQVSAALASQPAASFTGKSRLEDLGRSLGQELVLGGETPLWNSLTEALVAQQAGGNAAPADGVVVVRTVAPQRDGTSRFLLGLYSGLGSTGAPAVGVEQTDAADSATAVFSQASLSTVDDIDTRVGRLALVLLLAGQPSGQYGVKDSASNGALPPLPTPIPAGG